MDAVSALGVAAAVVQFADFGYRLIKRAHELYKSPTGQYLEHIELSVVSQDLLRLADDIGAKLGENKGSAAEIYVRLHGESADIIRAMFREVAAASDIEKLANRLGEIRQQMNVAMLYMLLDEARENGVELRQFARQQANMIATLDRIDSTTKQFSTDIIGLIDKWPISNQAETDKMVRYVLSDKWNASKYAKQTVFDEKQDDGKVNKVCQSLYFESISHRETSIPKRHKATFEWIFREPRILEDGRALWSSFPPWLRGDSPDIYWITGKPGAGKSTLTKFISQDPRFKDLLQEWATGSQLLIVRFFSWTSGANRLQKSQEGLFKTLLFEAIQQRPQLVIDIFPARWFLLQSFNGNIKLPDLTRDDLKVGFRNLLSATGDKVKLTLLIDGLDEFTEDQHEDHRDLVRLLRDANAEPGVKICISSRPWNVFRDEYGNNPMLQLENLTREDIKSFVQEQLELSPGYYDFAATDPEAARKIITDIVDKSQGVFLWVSVVSGMLEAALQEGTNISDLQATINNLPKEVDNLFRYIWNRTSKRFRAEASTYFLLMNTCRRLETDLFALTLWFGDKELPVDFATVNLTSTFLTGVIKSLERKLMSRTGGLLELVSSYDGHIPISLPRRLPERVPEYNNPAKKMQDLSLEPRLKSRTRHLPERVSEYNSPAKKMQDLSLEPRLKSRTTHLPERVSSSDVHAKKPEDVRVDYMHRTASDWVSDNWASIASAADHSFNPFIFFVKGQALSVILTTKPTLDRFTQCKFTRLTGVYWENWVEFSDFQNIISDMMQQIGQTLSCANFLEVSARFPIHAYLKHMMQENLDLFSTAAHYYGILNNVIFGESWFHDPEGRLDLLDFLTQEKYPLRLDCLCKTKNEVEYVNFIVSVKYSRQHPFFTYFTQVIHILESRISQPALQADQNRAAISSGGGDTSGTSVASEPQHQTPKPKLRDKLREFFGEIFGRKQS
ncbi:uncharacterized protein TrAtP1_006283 [Trichoderma atroviride]|uniref:uncharacterized protein n=1 Tax=Hypocrea atroviridis TaxID=63577 RepID=UPI0033299D6E|nr:hypothetical protein TrAtP1_006283 [Trichoderma atroviride]